MYQYASKDKTQSEKSKTSIPVADRSHVQMGTKTTVQTKSFFSPILSVNSNLTPHPAQLMPVISNSSFQTQLISNQEQKEIQPLQMKLTGEKEQLRPPTSINPNNTGIPLQMKVRFENLSGLSFDDVKVHYNSDKPAQLQALAYTQGNQVYIAPNQEKHLGHELGHVAQQKLGMVKPTRKQGNIVVNDDPTLENINIQQLSVSGGDMLNMTGETIVQFMTLNQLKVLSGDPLQIVEQLEAITGTLGKAGNISFARISLAIDIMEVNGFSPQEIYSVMKGANQNDTAKLLEIANNKSLAENYKTSLIHTFSLRLLSMARYAASVKRSLTDPEETVESTGSDPHAGGRHALFIKKGGHIVGVHKGHSLEVDKAFTGKGGMLDYLSSVITKDSIETKQSHPPFAVMDISPELHREEFVKKQETFSEADALVYYYQMGMLECASLVLGATDLHHDNIIPTKSGPIAIDAECVFIHTTNSTLIRKALREGVVPGGDDAAARFFVVCGQDRLHSDELYTKSTNRDPAVLKERFVEGYFYVLDILKKNKTNPAFKEKLRSTLSSVDRVRILPWATPTLASKLMDFIADRAEKKEHDTYNDLYLELTNYFSTNFPGKFVLSPQKRIAEKLASIFEKGTLPAVEIFIPEKQVLLDDECIGMLEVSVETILERCIGMITELDRKRKEFKKEQMS